MTGVDCTARSHRRRTVLVAMLLAGSMGVLLAGCERTPQRQSEISRLVERASSELPDAGATQTQPARAEVAAAADADTAANDSAEFGSGIVAVNPPPLPTPVASADSARDIVLNFQAADIQEVVQVIVGDMLGMNFVIDPSVTGTVTTGTSAGLRKSDLLAVLEALLRMNNAALLRRGDLIEVVPAATAGKTAALQLSRSASATGFSTRIYPLRYVGVLEMQKILEPLLPEGALVYVDERRNLLILAGTTTEQGNYQQTIASFDIDWMEGMSVVLFELDFAAPGDIAQDISEALGDESGKVMNGLVRLLELERINALLAISASAEALREVRRWVKRLDVAGDTREPKLYVIKLQNSKADDIASILAEVFADADNPQNRRSPVGLAPGNRAVEVASDDGGETTTRRSNSGASAASIAVALDGDIRIIADSTNNALVVMATPKEYELVAAAIEKLDIAPLQVLIEASIVEVTLTDRLEYGVEWFFKNGFAESKQGQGLLDLGAAGIGTLAPAFSYAVLDSIGDVRVVLNALESESDVNILSSPSLMVLDNHTALINVGDEIPVPTRQSVSNIDSGAPTVNEIQFRNTGVTLEVTPRVNAGGLVIMEIDQEVSAAIATTSSDLNAPTIQQRHISSTVAVQSGQTIVLGGLIRETNNTVESGVPLLRRIPVLGKLFGQTSESTERTELMVLITPRAIGNRTDAHSVTREYVEKMRTLN